MRLETFRGKTMAEALSKVKRRFGVYAVILSTRTLRRRGVLGLGGGECVEITAAAGMGDLPRPLRRVGVKPCPPRGAEAYDRSVEAFPVGRMSSGAGVSGAGVSRPVNAVASSQNNDPLMTEIDTLKSMVEDLSRQTRRACSPGVPDTLKEHESLFEAYLALVQNDVAEQIARDLVERVRRKLTPEQLGDQLVVRGELASALESMLPVAGPIKLTETAGPTIISLIGPTGVGKTTTLAKLAAHFCLREHKSVGLITIDTYRIAAVEQLKTYAQIIDVPLTVVMTPEQLKEAVKSYADKDVVLIDTAGRSPKDTLKINELKRFHTVVKPHETHLVLSGTCTESVLSDAVARFSEVAVDRIIFTKLDEAVGFGVILGCLSKANACLSYVTVGQDVPDDIEIGDGKRLAESILDNRMVRAGTLLETRD